MKTKITNLLFLLFLLAGFNLFAQTTFLRTFGDSLGESSFSSIQTNDKGYALSGFTKSHGAINNDFYILKTDSLANVLWSKIYSGNNSDEAYSIQQTADGGFIVAGTSKSFGALYSDACLLKLNSTGDTLWTKIYGAASFEFANTIIQTIDGGYVFAGYTEGNAIDSSNGSIYLVKTNSLGVMQWQKSLGTSSETVDAYSIEQTSDKGFVITGWANGYGEINGDSYILKTDSLGNPLFTKTYGFKGSDWGTSILQTADGGYVIGGTYSTDSTSLDVDAYIIKTDANGDTLWSKTYGGSGAEAINGLKQTSDGGYILTGYTTSFGGGLDDVYLIKTKANGDTLWTRAFGGINTDYGLGVVEANDKGFVIVGYTKSFALNNDVFLIKTDSLGNSTCNQFSTATQVNAVPTIVGATSTGKIFITLNSSVLSPTFRGGGTITDVCSTNEIKLLEEQKSVMHIYPNPNNGFFTVHFPENISGKLVINSLLGETVYTSTLQNNSIIDLSALPNGVYFLKAETTKIYTQRIIINK